MNGRRRPKSPYTFDPCTDEVRYRGRWYKSLDEVEGDRAEAAEMQGDITRDGDVSGIPGSRSRSREN